MNSCIDHSGYISINKTDDEKKKKTVRYAYDLKEGKCTIHAFDDLNELNGTKDVLGEGFDNTKYLLHFEIPFIFSDFNRFQGNYSRRLGFIIKGFEEGAKYSKAIFDFDELQYFCPSIAVVEHDKNDNAVRFLRQKKVVKSFAFNIADIKCDAEFVLSTCGKTGYTNSYMKAVTELRISFPDTDDLVFLERLYNIVDCVFAFVCNRRNTTCTSMKLIGSYLQKRPYNGEIISTNFPFQCEFFYFDYYREEPEEENIIQKTWDAAGFIEHIDKLFTIVSDDVMGKKEGISITSIHASVKRRNLIDLQQSLGISSAFEFYVREYLPNMVKENDSHSLMLALLRELKEKSTGSFKSIVSHLVKCVVSEPALKDKIIKVLNGYDNWDPLSNCFEPEWFKKEEIPILANEANQWRNELAHSKRKYVPSEQTIKAVRLLEHINYAIVLRQLGYTDAEIKGVLEGVLKRVY